MNCGFCGSKMRKWGMYYDCMRCGLGCTKHGLEEYLNGIVWWNIPKGCLLVRGEYSEEII